MSESPAVQKDQLLKLWQSVAEVSGHKSDDPSQRVIDKAEVLIPLLQKALAHRAGSVSAVVPLLDAALASSNVVIAPLLRVRLLFAEAWFDAFLQGLTLDTHIQGAAEALRPAFIRLALVDDSLFIDRNHIFSRLLRVLSVRLQTWYSAQGKVAECFPNSIHGLVESLSLSSGATSQSIMSSFLQQLDKEAARAKVQKERYAERIQAELKVTAVAARVEKLYQRSMVGQSLPVFVDKYVRAHLLAELQFVLINHGESHAFWRIWQRLLVLLPQFYDRSIRRSSARLMEYRAQIESVLATLKPKCVVQSTSQPLYDGFVRELSESLSSLHSGELVVVFKVEGESSAAASDGANTQVSRSLLRRVAAVKEGDWFVFSVGGGDTVRCQLALKLIEAKKLFFVNRSGFKVLEKSIDEFALCLSSQVAVPLLVESAFEACTAQAVNEMRGLYRASLPSYQAEKKRLALEKQEQLEKLEREKEFRQQAAEKAKREAAQLAEQERQRIIAEEAARQEAESGEHLRARQRADQIVTSLKVGSWMELFDEEKGSIRAKLAVIIPAAGKYIFVNRLGEKLAEYYRDDLVGLLESGEIKVLTQSGSFEDQLSKIVKGLRQ